MEEADKRRRPCTKRFRLALWWLVYRLPVLDGINRETEELGRKHCKYSEEAWARDRADFQSQWERMLAKRERRFRWYQKHGKVPDGWTPPDPKDHTPGNIPNERWWPRYQRSTECFGRCCSTGRITNLWQRVVESTHQNHGCDCCE